MKIILLQDIAKIGKKFDVKEISNGYALNFLLPKKLAKMATDEAVRELEGEKKKYEEARIIEQKEIRKEIEKIKDAPIEIKAKTNKEGKLFASIDKKEIVKAVKEQNNFDLDFEMIELKKPIKEIGEHKIILKTGEKETSLSLIVEKEK